MMPTTDYYCPTCGSAIDDEGECPCCLVDRPAQRPGPEGRISTCRRCGGVVSRRATACPRCGADHPRSVAGLAPVAEFVLGLFTLALTLALISLLAGPIVP